MKMKVSDFRDVVSKLWIQDFFYCKLSNLLLMPEKTEGQENENVVQNQNVPVCMWMCFIPNGIYELQALCTQIGILANWKLMGGQVEPLVSERINSEKLRTLNSS